MAKTYRGGLIGCGYVSRSHLAAWSRIEEAEIIAVSNRTREKAERRAEEFDVPAVYSDYRSMLDTEQLDFVDIATPPSVHLEMVAAAAKRGLPVLCQKPIAATLAELQEMMRICDEAGVSFMVNENCRFQPWFRKMKALIDQGVIGGVYDCLQRLRPGGKAVIARILGVGNRRDSHVQPLGEEDFQRPLRGGCPGRVRVENQHRLLRVTG